MSPVQSQPRTLLLRYRHPAFKLNRVLLRRLTQTLLQEELQRQQYDLGFYLVGEQEMTHINETFLQHKGSTDVITFDYTDPAEPERLTGEIFICLDESQLQARRFRTTWQSELVRYIVHGLLHLSGYDDLQPQARRKMKREENRLVRALVARFSLAELGKRSAANRLRQR